MKTKHNIVLHSFVGTVFYDPEGQLIGGVQASGHHQRLMDLRGWGGIQQLFSDHKEASVFQDHLGCWIADAINEKLKRESESLLFAPEFYVNLAKKMLEKVTLISGLDPKICQEFLEYYLKIFYTKYGGEKTNAIEGMCDLLRVSRSELNKMMYNPL